MTASKLLEANLINNISQTLIHQEKPVSPGLPDHSEQEDYKNSSIGFIPKDWKEASIGEVCNLQTGGTPSRNKPEFWNGNIPWIKTGEVDYCVIKESEEYITQSGLENSNAKIFPEGTLLIAMYGQGVTRGKVALMGIEAATNQACAALTPKDSSELCAEFLYFFLQYRYEELRNRGHGANQKNLSVTLIKLFPVVFPPTLNEQKKIAYVLSTVQRAIAQQEKIIQTTTELKKALMHKLFTEGLHGEKQKETEIGFIPESWNIVPLERVLSNKLQNGAFIKKPETGKGILFANVVDIYRDFYLDTSRLERINVSLEEVNRYLLDENDILVVRSSLKREGIGQNCVAQNLGEPVFYDCHLIRVSVNPDLISSEFLSYFWRSQAGKNALVQRSKTTTMTTINQASLSKSSIPLPKPDIQNEITAILLKLDDKVQIHESKKQALEDLFCTLLHKLMTAEIRIHDIDLPGFDENLEPALQITPVT